MSNHPSKTSNRRRVLAVSALLPLLALLVWSAFRETEPGTPGANESPSAPHPATFSGLVQTPAAKMAYPELPFSGDHPMTRRATLDFAEQTRADGTRVRIWITSTPGDPDEYLRVVETSTIDGISSVEVMMADRVLFCAADAEGERLLHELANLHGFTLGRPFRFQPTRIIHLGAPAIDAVPNALTALAPALRAPGSFVEPDRVSFPQETVPDDPKWDTEMWSLRQIDAPLAWDLTTGSSEVVVAVVDTKLSVTHPDLAANVWVNSGEIPGNGLDDDHNGYVDDLHGWNVNSDSGDLLLGVTNNHGEHVAGTIAAVGDNATGVVGVNWNTKVMFFATGDAISDSESVEGLEYAVWMKRNRGVHVVSSNHSYGALLTNSVYTGSSTRRAAIAVARDNGILFTAASGNDGKALEGSSDLNGDGTWHSFFPACNSVENFPSAGDWDSVVSVAASDSNDGKASFSNYNLVGFGTVVDLAAPGAGIHSTIDASGYADKSGTSMAAPHVAGAHALVAAANPALDALTIRDLVYAGVESVGAWTDTKTNEQGRLNLYSAVLAATHLPTVRLVTPVADSFIPSGHQMTLAAEASDGDGSVVSVDFHAVGNDGSYVLIGTDSDGSDGWTQTWINPPAGQYTLYTTATDNDGNTTVPDRGVTRVSVGSYYRDEDEQWPTPDEGIWSMQDLYWSGPYTGSCFGRGVAYCFIGAGGSAGEAFTFYLTPEHSGTWEVFLQWPYSAFNASSVPVELVHDGGIEAATVRMTSRNSGSKFNSLGTFSFTGGQTYTLKVLSTGLASEYLAVDAVRMDLQSAVEPPVVTIAASDAQAGEAGPDHGRFTLTRSLTTGSLTVHLSMGGSATAGSDYTAPATSVTFVDGESLKTIDLLVLDDMEFEPVETATLSILEDPAYHIAATSGSATVSIANNDPDLPPAEAWRYFFFGQSENTGDAADDFDYDGDGQANLIERAFATDPTRPTDVFRPSEERIEDSGSTFLAITYRQPMNGTGTTGIDYTADGIVYTVQYGQSLVDPWSEGGVTLVQALDDTPATGIQTVTVRLNTPATPTAPDFIRLKISAP